MTKEEIINGLKMSMELTLFDPSTGEVMEPYQLNDINRTAYEAYKGAVELLEKQPDITTHDSIPAETGENDDDGTSGDCISRQAAKDIFTELYGISAIGSVFDKEEWADICETTANELPSAQPERKAVFNRDIAIEAICDEVMLWFDVSATKAYEIAETAVKRIEVRMEKMNRGEKDG